MGRDSKRPIRYAIYTRQSVEMLRLWLGLTDIYNLFHDRDLTPALVAETSGKPAEARERRAKGR